MTEISSGSTPPGGQVPLFSRLWRFVTEPQLAVRVFFVLSALLVVAITATSATLLYNSANTLRDEAEANAVRLAELLADSYAEMGEISLANVARTLDATLDTQMTAQARIASQMVAAAEAAGYEPARVNEILDAITNDTVIDEFWITDEVGFSYLTNVKDDAGVRVPFRFDPDPAVQPQASKFFLLLAAAPEDDGFIVQPAVVREIDNEIVKYVGVGGADKSRIVQVGNVFNFGDQEILSNLAASADDGAGGAGAALRGRRGGRRLVPHRDRGEASPHRRHDGDRRDSRRRRKRRCGLFEPARIRNAGLRRHHAVL